MTLDEWKALQEQFKPKKADFKIRRAGEGVDDAQWGDMVALKKKEVSEGFSNIVGGTGVGLNDENFYE